MPEATAPLATRSPQSIAVDNLLRRELKIGDPSDPLQIAKGLLALYPDTADEMFRERAGLNYGAADLPGPVSNGSGAAGASQTELALAQDDLARDIDTLTTSSELKEIDVELKGWARAVRQASADGLAAAALALDPVQSDRAMAARRTLGDYARLARYVGALSADTAPLFRHFAQSCDVMAAMVLVGLGDGLAANGVMRSTTLLRVSASDLQSRRNGVIQAFRTMTGSGLVPTGQDDYPRGLEAYRIVTDLLQTSGQADLRTLLDEASLAAELDQLVDLAVGATSGGLRELSSRSLIVMDRLSRLVDVCRASEHSGPGGARVSTPEAPPMLYFASALQMFVDAFKLTTGGRLLYVARPPILAYGLYGAGPDDPTKRLIDLTLARGVLAERIDCVADCGCDEPSITRAVILDFLLYRLDRAIDLYAAGYRVDGRSEPEVRAAALAYVAGGAIGAADAGHPLPKDLLKKVQDPLIAPLPGVVVNPNGSVTVPGDDHQRANLGKELSTWYYAEERVENLVQSLSPRCVTSVFGVGDVPSPVRALIRGQLRALNQRLDPPSRIRMPQTIAVSASQIVDDFAPRYHG
jgi:hypothetical protein